MAFSSEAKKNRRPHPLRRERPFPHSLSMTEGVKIAIRKFTAGTLFSDLIFIVPHPQPAFVSPV